MILVTGGAGFIGSHTVRALRGEGREVRVLDDLSTGKAARLDGLGAELRVGSITRRADVEAALRGVSAVIHLAARISVAESVEDPHGYEAVNVGGFITLLEAAQAAGVSRVVYASSCAVYGAAAGLPLAEDTPLQPLSPYAATKMANEAWASASSATGGPATVGLRYFNVFGPEQDPAGPYGAVIPTFVSRALAGQALHVHGDGLQGRDFVSVRDVARANVAAALAGTSGAVVCNVGGGRMLTIAELAARVVADVAAVPVVHGPARVGDVRESQADVRRAGALLGWRPEADFDAALREVVAWFRAAG